MEYACRSGSRANSGGTRGFRILDGARRQRQARLFAKFRVASEIVDYIVEQYAFSAVVRCASYCSLFEGGGVGHGESSGNKDGQEGAAAQNDTY